MKFNLDEVIAWLIVGALAGSLAGMIVKRHRAGFGRIINLAVGLIGAVIGGVVFKIIHINLGLLGSITITSEEVVESFHRRADFPRDRLVRAQNAGHEEHDNHSQIGRQSRPGGCHPMDKWMDFGTRDGR